MDAYWNHKTQELNSKIEFVPEITEEKVSNDGKLIVEDFDLKKLQRLAIDEKERVIKWLKETFPYIYGSGKNMKLEIREYGNVLIKIQNIVDDWMDIKNNESIYETSFTYERKRKKWLDSEIKTEGKEEVVLPCYVRIMDLDCGDGKRFILSTPTKVNFIE